MSDLADMVSCEQRFVIKRQYGEDISRERKAAMLRGNREHARAELRAKRWDAHNSLLRSVRIATTIAIAVSLLFTPLSWWAEASRWYTVADMAEVLAWPWKLAEKVIHLAPGEDIMKLAVFALAEIGVMTIIIQMAYQPERTRA